MTETLSRLAGPANLASGNSTVFTGVAGHTYLIRSIVIANNTAATVKVKLGIGGITDALLIHPAISIATKGKLDINCFLVLSGAETLQANASATGTTITVCGLDQS
jgi:hypothetical protein